MRKKIRSMMAQDPRNLAHSSSDYVCLRFFLGPLAANDKENYCRCLIRFYKCLLKYLLPLLRVCCTTHWMRGPKKPYTRFKPPCLNILFKTQRFKGLMLIYFLNDDRILFRNNKTINKNSKRTARVEIMLLRFGFSF